VTGRHPADSLARGLLLLAAMAGLHAGCAEAIGKRAASGAVSELRRQSNENPDQRPARIAAASAVEGAVEALDTPEQRARIDRLIAHAVSVAATTAVENATRQLVADLGPDGRGPLAVSIKRTGEQLTSSVTSSVTDQVGSELAALVPECPGPDRLACLERRLQQTARVTATSFTTGVKDSIGWQILLVAFALGAGGGVLGAWLWSLRHYRRRTLRMA